MDYQWTPGPLGNLFTKRNTWPSREPGTNIFLRIMHPKDIICIAEMVSTHNGWRKPLYVLKRNYKICTAFKKYLYMPLLTRNTICSNHMCNWVYMSSKIRKHSAFTIKWHPPHRMSVYCTLFQAPVPCRRHIILCDSRVWTDLFKCQWNIEIEICGYLHSYKHSRLPGWCWGRGWCWGGGGVDGWGWGPPTFTELPKWVFVGLHVRGWMCMPRVVV